MNPELQSGATLGHYELLTQLGRGGMASVWVARESSPVSGKQRLVAVKAMLPELARHSAFRAMFLGEGQIVRSIDHPNVVKVHEVSEDRGVLYMAMDWVEGDSLRAVIREAKRRRAIPAEMAVKIIADAASGLHAAHELRGWDGELRNIVHCDISPHNILVGLDGQAKLVDFGVANATAHSDLESQDQLKGKFGYMSPEQASAGKIDRRSDVFALGIVLFELTTGERLFRGENPAHTLLLVKNAPIPDPRQIFANYPAGLAAIVQRALARDVNARFQTAAEFRDALEQYLTQERVLVSPAGVGQLVRRVLGPRIEQQRQALREALTAADGKVAAGLVPELPAAPDRSASGVSSAPPFALPSEPPSSASSSQFSNSRTGKTPHGQTLERERTHGGGAWPLLAAVLGISAAAGAIFWVTHRPGPVPLITSQRTNGAVQATPRNRTPDDPPGPVGIDIDSLPTAPGAATETPDAEAMNQALTGRAAERSRVAPTPRTNKQRRAEHAGAAVTNSLPEPQSAPEPERAPEPRSALELERPPEPIAQVPAPVATPLPPVDQRASLNRGAALAALGTAASSVAGCKRPGGPSGSGSARTTFSPDGVVLSVTVSAPFAGTPVGQCVATVFRGAHVPPFSGSSITLPKSFQIPE